MKRNEMARLLTARAVVLALALLSGGTVTDAARKPRHEASVTSSLRVVNLTSNSRSADDGAGAAPPLVLEARLDDEAEFCDGSRQTATGTAVLSGTVSGGAFSLVDVNVTTVLHCGERAIGQPVFDVTAEALDGPLNVTLVAASDGEREEKSLPSYSISASIYDDAETGGHFIAGTLRAAAEEGDHQGGEVYWFDTCAASFEVR